MDEQVGIGAPVRPAFKVRARITRIDNLAPGSRFAHDIGGFYLDGNAVALHGDAVSFLKSAEKRSGLYSEFYRTLAVEASRAVIFAEDVAERRHSVSYREGADGVAVEGNYGSVPDFAGVNPESELCMRNRVECVGELVNPSRSVDCERLFSAVERHCLDEPA